MAQQKTYIVWRVADNTMRTVLAGSQKSAMKIFFATYPGADCGEEFKIKERLSSDDWAMYRYFGNGRSRRLT